MSKFSQDQYMKAVECLESHCHDGRIADIRVPSDLLPVIESVCGNNWKTIDRGETACLTVTDEDMDALREMC